MSTAAPTDRRSKQRGYRSTRISQITAIVRRAANDCVVLLQQPHAAAGHCGG